MAHLLCMRKNPTLGLNILHEACEGTDLISDWPTNHSDQPMRDGFIDEPMRDP